jgi:hypothetical protein
MSKTIFIIESDVQIKSINSFNEYVSFKTYDGDEICLEEKTIKRGLKILEDNEKIRDGIKALPLF